ncbi:hypothetical protein Cgig2_022620 [Carnegiea gigantea]|uniref:Uncharacterized protein n=1 Tax=Carnegiea gigantea TaxID=171969 RepID=A0A9Q1GKV4_9CARY|nr:hypothetical protein Cgig2_022620 [Carnegiea gigantea]
MYNEASEYECTSWQEVIKFEEGGVGKEKIVLRTPEEEESWDSSSINDYVPDNVLGDSDGNVSLAEEGDVNLHSGEEMESTFMTSLQMTGTRVEFDGKVVSGDFGRMVRERMAEIVATKRGKWKCQKEGKMRRIASGCGCSYLNGWSSADYCFQGHRMEVPYLCLSKFTNSYLLLPLQQPSIQRNRGLEIATQLSLKTHHTTDTSSPGNWIIIINHILGDGTIINRIKSYYKLDNSSLYC